MNFMLVNYILLAISLMISVVAQTILKSGMREIGVIADLSPANIFSLILVFASSWQIVLGLFMYIGGLFLWLVLLSRLDLSFLYPIGALQYILIFLFSSIFLGEHITWGRIVGLVFVLLGIYIIQRFGKSEHQYL